MKDQIKLLLNKSISAVPERQRTILAMTVARALGPADRNTILSTIGPTEFLLRFFEHFKVDCVFDVGANQGQFASMVREGIGFQGPIISFEPIPTLSQKLRQAAKSDPNWHIEEIALDREAGVRPFNIMKDNQFSSLLEPSQGETGYFADLNSVEKHIEVKTSTLDTMFRVYHERLGFKRPFLKMDTQGNDLAVSEGGVNVLGLFVGLQTEVGFRRLYERSADFSQSLAYFRERGFDVSNLLPNNAGSFPHLFEADMVMFNTKMA